MMKALKLVNDTIKLKKLATEPDKPVKNPSEKIDALQLELLRAQLALGLAGAGRERVLRILLEETAAAVRP